MNRESIGCAAIVLGLAGVLSGGCTNGPGHVKCARCGWSTMERPSVSADDIARVLDALHVAASKADARTYWSLFDPGAVFLGTDASERWTLDQFKAYATPYFEKAQGWTYRVQDRHIGIHDDGRTAWFDERLQNEKYGECRGSGVLVRVKPGVPVCEGFGTGGRWVITQYNLTVPIPNDLLADFAERIRAFQSGGGR